MNEAVKYGLIAAVISSGIIAGSLAVDAHLEKEPECSDALRSEFKQAVIASETPMSIKSGRVQLELADGTTCNMRLNY